MPSAGGAAAPASSAAFLQDAGDQSFQFLGRRRLSFLTTSSPRPQQQSAPHHQQADQSPQRRRSSSSPPIVPRQQSAQTKKQGALADEDVVVNHRIPEAQRKLHGVHRSSRSGVMRSHTSTTATTTTTTKTLTAAQQRHSRDDDVKRSFSAGSLPDDDIDDGDHDDDVADLDAELRDHGRQGSLAGHDAEDEHYDASGGDRRNVDHADHLDNCLLETNTTDDDSCVMSEGLQATYRKDGGRAGSGAKQMATSGRGLSTRSTGAAGVNEGEGGGKEKKLAEKKKSPAAAGAGRHTATSTATTSTKRASDAKIFEVQEGLFMATLKNPEKFVEARRERRGSTYFWVEKELLYHPFSSDFGPLRLSCIVTFCRTLSKLLEEGRAAGKRVVFCCSAKAEKKANAAVLMGAFCVLVLKQPVPDVAKKLEPLEPLVSFRDASSRPCLQYISVLDCLEALEKARDLRWLDASSFDVAEYERLDEADITWIVPGKVLAFSTPAKDADKEKGYLAPEDYVDYFKKANVSGIVRLNKKVYDKRRFTSHGFDFYDLFFPDGSTPSDQIVKKFLRLVEKSPGALAVHCKAGLGRTGVLIGCFIMKHFSLSAQQAVSYMRLARPGSVIGIQHPFLLKIQHRMWKMGEEYRDWLSLEAEHYGDKDSFTYNSAVSDALTSDADSFATEAETDSSMAGLHDIPKRKNTRTKSVIRVSSTSAAAAAVAELHFARDASESDASIQSFRRRDRSPTRTGAKSRRRNWSISSMGESSDAESLSSFKSATSILVVPATRVNASFIQTSKPDPELAPRLGRSTSCESVFSNGGEQKESQVVRMTSSSGQPRKVVSSFKTEDELSTMQQREQLDEDFACQTCMAFPPKDVHREKVEDEADASQSCFSLSCMRPFRRKRVVM